MNREELIARIEAGETFNAALWVQAENDTNWRTFASMTCGGQRRAGWCRTGPRSSRSLPCWATGSRRSKNITDISRRRLWGMLLGRLGSPARRVQRGR